LEELEQEREEAEAARLADYKEAAAAHLAEYEYITANADRLQAAAKVERGYSLEHSGLSTEALQMYQQALTLDPSYYPAYHRSMMVCTALERHDASKSLARVCMKLATKAEWLSCNSTKELCQVLGRYEDDEMLQREFCEFLRTAIQLLPVTDEYFLLAAELAASRHRAVAVEMTERAWREHPTLVAGAMRMSLAPLNERSVLAAQLEFALRSITLDRSDRLCSDWERLVLLRDGLNVSPEVLSVCRGAVLRRCEMYAGELELRLESVSLFECDNLPRHWEKLLVVRDRLNLPPEIVTLWRAAVLRRCEMYLSEFCGWICFDDVMRTRPVYDRLAAVMAKCGIDPARAAQFREALCVMYRQWRAAQIFRLRAEARERARWVSVRTSGPKALGCLASVVAFFGLAALVSGHPSGAIVLGPFVGPILAYHLVKVIAKGIATGFAIRAKTNQLLSESLRELDRKWSFLREPMALETFERSREVCCTCGAAVFDGSKFCGNCGRSIGGGVAGGVGTAGAPTAVAAGAAGSGESSTTNRRLAMALQVALCVIGLVVVVIALSVALGGLGRRSPAGLSRSGDQVATREEQSRVLGPKGASMPAGQEPPAGLPAQGAPAIEGGPGEQTEQPGQPPREQLVSPTGAAEVPTAEAGQRPPPTPAAPTGGVSLSPVTAAASQGIVTWSGRINPNTILTIEGSTATLGKVGGELPGVPVMIEVDPSDVEVVSPPGPENGWKRVILRTGKQRRTSIQIRWQTVR
jgi:tetratricopeptide (TPR) repeat protein